MNNLSEDLLVLIALTAVIGAAVYYFYALNWPGIIISLILIIGAFILYRRRRRPEHEPSGGAAAATRHGKIILIVYGLSYLAMMLILLAARTERALISPWEMVNYGFFWLYGLASLLLALLLLLKESGRWKILLLSAHYFLSFAVALIVYQIGYGFDPFVHRATMELIAAKGLVLPKPPYYLGQYGLIVIISRLSGLTIHFLNQVLVPLLSALFLPPAIYRFLISDDQTATTESRTGNLNYLVILFLLAMTFSPFILTTPQNLGYLFLMLTVLAGLSRRPLAPVFLLALATVAIHPLTGLPALAWATWLAYERRREKLTPRSKKTLAWSIWLFIALGLPGALFWSNGHSLNNLNSGWSAWFAPLQQLIAEPSSAGREDWLLNLIYFLAHNYNLLIIAAIVAAFWFARRLELARRRLLLNGPLFMSTALITAYLLSRQINFNDLIDYEQAAYADRLPIIVMIFCLPLLAEAGRALIGRILTRPRLERAWWLACGLILLLASLYLSYPRFDKYWNSRGYSTSANDLAAVRSIADRATGPYVVLANQQVSAAALQEFGFDHYYESAAGPLYFYPIPTGGPLYQYYLDMVYKNPVPANLDGACRLAGVPAVYLIVNKYWHQSGRIINEAKLQADSWWDINGAVYIFAYSC
ncbi:MAG: hypothetical protein WC453_01080 [Patescibacteria group bacterium]